MKKIYSYLLCALSIPLISADICNAQSTALALKSPKNAVVIDGNSQEWGDSLDYYNAEKKIHYGLANDKTNLYLVVKTKDPAQITNIMRAGLTFSIDTKGRKRSSFSTTFPYTENANPAMAAMPGPAEQTQQQKAAMAMLTRFKKIKVDGFKDISEDNLATTNTYNIQTVIGYDADGSLVYEEAIPLALFHATPELAKGEWSFNIKMNGIEAASSSQPNTGDVSGGAVGASPGGRGGKAGGLNGMAKSEANMSALQSQKSTPTIDFWGKFTLAQ